MTELHERVATLEADHQHLDKSLNDIKSCLNSIQNDIKGMKFFQNEKALSDKYEQGKKDTYRDIGKFALRYGWWIFLFMGAVLSSAGFYEGHRLGLNKPSPIQQLEAKFKGDTHVK